MSKVIPVCNKRLQTVDRMQSAQLRIGREIDLPPGLFTLYVQEFGEAGVVKTKKAKEPEVVEVVEEAKEPGNGHARLIAIASAINDILDEGDESKLTTEGEVRTSVLSAELGFKVTSEERDAAMELA